MNILVTGANGQLGQCLRDCVENGTDTENTWFWTDVSGIEGRRCDYLDIMDEEAVRKFFTDKAISVCVNCAAYTNVDKAEEDQEMARKLNADAPKILAEACKIHGSKLLHISTDYVHNGTSFIPITEDRPAFPMSVYGKTKLEGEENIINSGCKYLIFRTAWLYSEYGNNFVKTMLKLTAEKDDLYVVNDQIGTPTYARDLANLIYTAIMATHPLLKEGVYNYTDNGVCSWYDFTYMINKMRNEYSAEHNCRIKPISTRDFYGSKKHAPRPFYSVLSKKKVENDFPWVPVPYWTNSLALCIENLLKNNC